MNIELKPCPFCGGEAEFGGNYHTGYFVECQVCGTNDPLPNLSWSMEEVAAAWNKRAERTCVVEEVVKRERPLAAPTWDYQFSCGHLAYGWTWKEAPAYCPDCGAKVVE